MGWRTGDSSDEIDQTYGSLRKLAQLDFETILVARGEPVLEDGSNVMSLITGLRP